MLALARMARLKRLKFVYLLYLTDCGVLSYLENDTHITIQKLTLIVWDKKEHP